MTRTIPIQMIVYCPMLDCDADVDDQCRDCEWYGGHNNYELDCEYGDEEDD